MTHTLFLLRRLSKKLSVRATAFGLFAILVALIAAKLADLVPNEWAQLLGNRGVDNILQIVASSMLMVVTFSLATMVSAYASASEGVTPRAARLLIEDHQSQNTISIFLGAFIFSIVSIVALSTGYYGDKGRLILFVFTVFLIALIVWTILQWIERLAKLGRVHETILRVEQATSSALGHLAHEVHARCEIYEGDFKGQEVKSDQVGYLKSIDFESLQNLCSMHKIKILLNTEVGKYVHKDQIIAYVKGGSADKDQESLKHELIRQFDIGDCRLFDHDPRFGFIVLGEVASRALSPAVNDPGTAIDVVASAVRLFTLWSEEKRKKRPHQPSYNNIHIRPFRSEVFFHDIIRPISRDGAGHLEVVIRLFKALKAIENLPTPDLKTAAVRYQRIVVDRANQSLKFEEDRDFLNSMVQNV